ncbi:MAG TPA: class I SAM-dependent methyltransferase [Bryobacteraceae bacterium]|nr:class I SAM-dependent methyltransferase [Bryobacteraceae bacterium]
MLITEAGEDTLASETNYLDMHRAEVAQGTRFEFGENWGRFLSVLNEDRIRQAERSLAAMLEIQDLHGKTFLDIGSGSGLFSLAARRLGARAVSFDYDPSSVACTAELRRRYFVDDPDWTVIRGSALDRDFVASLKLFDIVYAWGVLHHTGEMWKGLENAEIAVAPGGKLFIAIYNDAGTKSKRWLWVKKKYNQLPRFLRGPFALLVSLPEETKAFLRVLMTGRASSYFRRWGSDYSVGRRGMSRWHDMVDWVGGYPYEYAKAEEIFDFYKHKGFSLTRMICGNVGTGCNEFVFRRNRQDSL